MTHNRLEAKYLITETQALAIREAAAPHVFLDPHASSGNEYPVESVYLDSPDERLYWSSATGENNRFKLRLRRYAGQEGAPVFVEIKRRLNAVITKQRACLPAPLAESFMAAGRLPEAPALDSRQTANLLDFAQLMARVEAVPHVAVRYMREAYQCRLEPHTRITFDRRIEGRPATQGGDTFDGGSRPWTPVSGLDVVLEMKFTDRYAFWFRPLIQRFGLERSSIAKYVVCVDALRGIRNVEFGIGN